MKQSTVWQKNQDIRKSQYRLPVAKVFVNHPVGTWACHQFHPVWETLTDLSVFAKDSHEIHIERSRLLGSFICGSSHFTWRTTGRLWYHWSYSVFYFLQRQFSLNGPLLSTAMAIILPSPSTCTESQEHAKLERWSTQRYHLICSSCSVTWNPETWKAEI